ncbi:ABC transporter permease [Actinophytocola sp.]|uniref:ABC transporter permease n=1 Tax=Actinophytocola sp. TaxID=1872138 RepID=UPI002D806C9F|nr:FtsX-like permease family protein [Actinophytocola sp.]HET9138499.1 FtsX-like permease family protein [Actinophytocola sp.]
MLRATLKSVLARKLRLVLSGLAVVLGVMFVAGAFVLTDTLGRSFDAMFASAYSETDVNVAGKPKIEMSELDGEEVPALVPAEVRDRVAKVPGVAEATGDVLADGARVIGPNGKVVSTAGAPRFGENWNGESDLVRLREGRGPTAPDEIAVNAATAEAAKLKVGDRVGVLTLQPKRMFTVVGVYGYSGDRDSLGGTLSVSFTEPVAQELMLGEPGVYSSVSVRAAAGVDPVALRDDIRAALGTTYEVKTGAELAKQQTDEFQQGLSFFNNILLGFAGVALFVGIFLILNTFSIIIAQRTRELALMRAVGASRRQMIGSVMVEAAVIGLVASALGLGAGIGVGALLASVFAGFGDLDLAGVGVPATAVISSFVVGLLVTLVAAVLPAVRASRIPPVAAMQDVGTPDRPLTRLTVAGAIVGAAGGGLLAWGLSGEAGDGTLWTILAGVLVSFVGVALLTPLLSRPVVSLLGRLFSWSVPGKLGRLNSGRNPRRTAITAAALMVGIALITGVSVILDSTKSSFTKLADEQVKAEIFIDGEQSGDRPPSFDPKVLEDTAALPGVARSAGVYSDLALVDGKREWVVATEDVPDLAAIFSVVPEQGAVGPLRDDQFILDTGTAADLGGLKAGDTVPFQFSRGEARPFTVAAVYTESDLYSGIVLPESAAKDFGVPQPVEAYVQLAAGTAVGPVLDRMNALLADNPEFSAVDRAAFMADQTDDLDTLLLMIQMLLGLAILIAVLGIINTLALSVIERTRELGLLRAIGMRRAQTMRMITVEAVVISVFGALLGLAVGSGLGASVVRALKSEGITELVLPWQQMGVYLVLAAVVGVVAAVLPAIRAARLNVLGAIAHE